jgi:hypothetical protein
MSKKILPLPLILNLPMVAFLGIITNSAPSFGVLMASVSVKSAPPLVE